MLDSIKLDITETMNDVVIGMPDELAKTFLNSILEMGCIMVQCGDIKIDVAGEKDFKLKITALAKAGTRNLEVNLKPV